jgi:hypothetical protein
MANVINATSTGNGGLVSTGDDSGILNIQTNETTAITVDASQNVGIGVTSPAYKLDLLGGNTPAQIASNDATASIGITLKYNTSTVYGYLGNGSSILSGAASSDFVMRSQGALAFATNGNSERMRIDSSGNLLVGKTSQTNTGKLEIDYSRATHAGTSYNETSSSSSCTHIAFQRGGTGVGSISSPNNSSTAYNTSSDYRLKENITPMTGALAKVAQLKPVTYKWKVDGSDGEGFIAHELAEVKPDCVSGDKDAIDADGNPVYQGIDTSFLVATLTAALQETKALIDTQAETINALTARIVALEEK